MTSDRQRIDEEYLLKHGATQLQADAWRARHPWGDSDPKAMDDYLRGGSS